MTDNLDRFFKYLVENRGLIRSTCRNYLYWVQRMLDSGLEPDDFVGQIASGSSRTNARVACQHWARFMGLGPLTVSSGKNPERATPSYRPRTALEQMIQWCKMNTQPNTHMCAVLLYRAGLRVSELAGLRRQDIDLEARELVVTGKGNKRRRVPMGSMLHTELSRYIAGRSWRPDDWLVTGERGGRLPAGTAAHVAWKQDIYDAMRATGNWGLHARPLHWLRHMFAVHFIEAGGTINALATILGHSNLNTTMIYLRAAGLQESTRILEDADYDYERGRGPQSAGAGNTGDAGKHGQARTASAARERDDARGAPRGYDSARVRSFEVVDFPA